MKRHTSLLRNEKGYAFLLVFITIILVTVLGLSILRFSNNTLTTSAHERDDQSIYYIAEAGLNYGRENFNQNIETAYNAAVEKYDEAKLAFEKEPNKPKPEFSNF